MRTRLFAVLAALVVTLSACGINSIPTAEEEAKAKWADVQAQYQRRANLIPNLVSTVKGYATHEKDTLESVIEARNKATSSPSSDTEAQFKVSLDRLLALAEAYPDLKANANFQALQGELADIEDKLAAARRALNAAVARYNAAIEAFPAVLFAGMLGFKEENFNQLDASEKGVVDQVPQVQF